MRVADVPSASRMARTWGGVGAGANYGWGERYAIYGQVDADVDFSGSYIVTATAGFRMMFQDWMRWVGSLMESLQLALTKMLKLDIFMAPDSGDSPALHWPPWR